MAKKKSKYDLTVKTELSFDEVLKGIAQAAKPKQTKQPKEGKKATIKKQ